METIRKGCFSGCGFEKIVIPKSVRNIEDEAFEDCKYLRSLAFEEGSLLEQVGKNVLARTPLAGKNWLFPSTAHIDVDTGMHP